MNRIALVTLTLLVLVLAACSSRGPQQRINPPTVTVQELRFNNDDGSCLLRIRIQNHSTVSMRYTSLRFDELRIDGRELAPLATTPNLDVPPRTGEPFDHTFDCAGLTSNASELVYSLRGLASGDQPRNTSFPFRFSSRLLPVPGLSGVYR